MSFSYATGENSSFVLAPSRDYLLGRDRSEHEIPNRIISHAWYVAHAVLAGGLPIAAGHRAAPLPRVCRACGTLGTRTRCSHRRPVASEERSDQAVQYADQAALGTLTSCLAVRAT